MESMNKSKVLILSAFFWLSAFAFVSNNLTFGQTQTRGAGNVRIKNEAGKVEEVKLYDGSFALIIGVSDYTNGWKSLSGVKTDVAAVKTVLEAQGFTVKTVINPTGEQLQSALNNFVRDYGYKFGNRLLMYYAGHGDTETAADGRKLGYIVPADAPLPSKDPEGFQKTAISMNDFEYYATRIQAKHALFVFDSCFSGTLLNARRSSTPFVITMKATQPVRQFITAGAADQEVPDISIFRQQFIEGINGEADRNTDGYITGSELADYLQEKVTNYSHGSQTPQYGKIFDSILDKGDFIFVVSQTPGVTGDSLPAKSKAYEKPIIKVTNGEENSTKTVSSQPINVGAVNSKVILAIQPPYPAAAKPMVRGVIQTVQVRITADEQGNVIEAEAINGNRLLKSGAVAAAKQSKLSVTKISSQSVKISGILTYYFCGSNTTGQLEECN